MTKKVLLILVCLLAVITFGSCSEENEIKDIAKNYLMAFKSFELTEAKKYGTSNTAAFLDGMQMYVDQADPQELQKTKELMKGVDVVIDNVAIKEEKATVTYHFLEKNKTPNKESLNMVKQEGKWLVDEDVIF